jgi:hypothetical protein
MEGVSILFYFVFVLVAGIKHSSWTRHYGSIAVTGISANNFCTVHLLIELREH